MYKILHLSEAEKINDIPVEVVDFVKEILKTLDAHYGSTRSWFDDGGYVCLFQPNDNIYVIDDTGLDVKRLIPEHTDLIETAASIDYIHAMILTNNEHSLHIIMEKDKATPNLLNV